MEDDPLREPESMADPRLVHPSVGPVSIRLQEVIHEYDSLFSVQKSHSHLATRSGMFDAIGENPNSVNPGSMGIVSRKLHMGGSKVHQGHKPQEP